MSEKLARTYRISKETLQRLEQLVTKHQTYPSPLVDMLLQRALDEVEAGNWQLHREPVKYVTKW